MKQATFAKLRDGSFGLRGVGLVDGERVQVTTKAGKVSVETVGRVISGPFDDGNVIATMVGSDVSAAAMQAAPRPAARQAQAQACGTCGGTGLARGVTGVEVRALQPTTIPAAARAAWGAAPATGAPSKQDDDIPF